MKKERERYLWLYIYDRYKFKKKFYKKKIKNIILKKNEKINTLKTFKKKKKKMRLILILDNVKMRFIRILCNLRHISIIRRRRSGREKEEKK